PPLAPRSSPLAPRPSPLAPMLVDSHCHIDGPEFAGDFAEMLGRAADAGVRYFICIGVGADGARRALRLAEEIPGVYATAGVHPHDAAAATESEFSAIRDLLRHPKMVAVGEIGLDFHGDRAPRDAQQPTFERQLDLAQETGKPVVIHCREAEEAVEATLARRGGRLRGVMHCFGGTAAQAARFIARGLLVSIPGTVTFKNAERTREVARATPVEQMVIETDSPYLAPAPFRGRRNEPAHVRLVAEAVAALRGLSFDDVARVTSRNALELFGVRDPEMEKASIVYQIRGALYVNLTNRCNAGCVFCPRATRPVIKGHNLGLPQAQEPTPDEVLAAVGDPTRFSEVVFCGFGEPTLRLPELLESAGRLKAAGATVRLNTNGLGNLQWGRDITPDLAGKFDVLSISLNTANPAQYEKIMRTDFPGADNFGAMLEFARRARLHVPQVVLTALDGFPGVDIAACERIAAANGLAFRRRVYDELG
ncbi:MAG: YchF/TatD family DNA exonuclease, partial [Planctomycetes bacterium]|nr:YchF/TatD family DNA exonuclease [Planctomycetota bacterium]